MKHTLYTRQPENQQIIYPKKLYIEITTNILNKANVKLFSVVFMYVKYRYLDNNSTLCIYIK